VCRAAAQQCNVARKGADALPSTATAMLQHDLKQGSFRSSCQRRLPQQIAIQLPSGLRLQGLRPVAQLNVHKPCKAKRVRCESPRGTSLSSGSARPSHASSGTSRTQLGFRSGRWKRSCPLPPHSAGPPSPRRKGQRKGAEVSFIPCPQRGSPTRKTPREETTRTSLRNA